MAKRHPKNTRRARDGPDEADRELVSHHIAARPGRSAGDRGTVARSKRDKEGLDDFERSLVEAYCLTLNQKRALHLVQARAGAKLTSRQSASLHFRKPHVQAAIDRRLSEDTAYSARLRREVLESLVAVLRAELKDVFGADGNLLGFREMPANARAALTEVTVKEYEGGRSTRVKLANKLVAAKLLMEHLGMFDAVDPMEAERRKIEDAGPELRRRVTELGERLRAGSVPSQPEPGGGEEASL